MTSKATVFDFGITVPVFCYLNHWYNSTGSVLAHASYSSQTTVDDEESASCFSCYSMLALIVHTKGSLVRQVSQLSLL